MSTGFRMIRSRSVVLPVDNIDTDQIIPARFLTTTHREGLGQSLFQDWRFDDAGCPRPGFILNQPAAEGCEVLVAGRNFGCGSSREHAPWALLDYGFRAVISTEIADIFRSNALRNGLLALVVEADVHDWLMARPGVEVSIDLEACRLHAGDEVDTGFDIEPFARYCLLNGIDPLGYLLSRTPDIECYEARS
ncbi:MAG: 3-isopropylmalate dehydratase small subunit [Gammaproteobacteria bacterium]